MEEKKEFMVEVASIYAILPEKEQGYMLGRMEGYLLGYEEGKKENKKKVS